MASNAQTQHTSPNLTSYIKSLRNVSADVAIDHLIDLLRRRQIHGSHQCALATTQVFLKIVSKTKLRSSAALLAHVRAVGKRLASSVSAELAVGNITRRVLGLIREATETSAADHATELDALNPTGNEEADEDEDDDDDNDEANHEETEAKPDPQPDLTAPDPHFRQTRTDILSGLREMLDELDTAPEQIAAYGPEHISAGDVVLTYGASPTVARFLLAAAKRRSFTVLYAESYPNEDGKVWEGVEKGTMTEDGSRLKTLAAAGVSVVMIPDAAVWAVMPRVTKVLLAAHAVCRDGGFVGAGGAGVLARAAKWHRVPLIVLGAVYRFSPVWAQDIQGMLVAGDPGRTATKYVDADLVEDAEVLNVSLEWVGKEYVSLVVSNIGGHAPGFVYRIVADHYRPEDTDL